MSSYQLHFDEERFSASYSHLGKSTLGTLLSHCRSYVNSNGKAFEARIFLPARQESDEDLTSIPPMLLMPRFRNTDFGQRSVVVAAYELVDSSVDSLSAGACSGPLAPIGVADLIALEASPD